MRGCPAINRHKNKLQLPSMNKFYCNLLCIPFFSCEQLPLPHPLALHAPPATIAFAAWVTTQKAFEILVYKSQPKRGSLFVCARSGLGSCWGSGWGSVIWFQFSLCFYLSLGLSAGLQCVVAFCSNLLSIPFRQRAGGVAVQYTNCVCVCCSLQSLSI